MKKVIFYIDTLQTGGIEKVLIENLKNIDKKKFHIELLIGYKLEGLEKFKDEIPKEISINYIFENNIYTYFKRKKANGNISKIEKILNETLGVLRKVKILLKLKKLCKEIDVIVDFDMTLAPFVKYIDIQKITFCHFSPKNYNRGIKGRQKKLFRRLLRYDHVVVISKAMKEEMLTLCPNLEEKIIKIYNSLNIESIRKKAEIINDEDIKLLSDDYILAIGRLEETQKDFTTLIESYALISEKIEEKLYIIGDGRDRENLERLVQNLELGDKIKFLGLRLNPYPFIKCAKLFVHSSKFEGLPTVMLEALILEKLIIATDCPTGPREILENGEVGILVEVGNKEKLAKEIYEALSEDKYNKFKVNIQNKVRDFDAKYVIKELEKIL